MQPNGLNQSEKDDHAEDNPALSKIIERIIRTIVNSSCLDVVQTHCSS